MCAASTCCNCAWNREMYCGCEFFEYLNANYSTKSVRNCFAASKCWNDLAYFMCFLFQEALDSDFSLPEKVKPFIHFTS